MQKQNIILVHPLHDTGIPAQIKPILDKDFPNHVIIEICPVVDTIPKAADWDYEEFAARQEAAFRESLKPTLEANPLALVTYFGIAPIPLIMHLGFLCQIHSIDARNRTHGDRSWDWQGRSTADSGFNIVTTGVPKKRVSKVGQILMIVETSFKVDEDDAAKAVPNPVRKIVIRTKTIDPNGIKSRAEMKDVAEAFWNALNQIKTFCHPNCEIHLFAGVPAGLAFMMGAKIHASSHHKVVTYKYVSDRTPIKHIRALAIEMRAPEPVRILFVGANPEETEVLDLENEAKTITQILKSSWKTPEVSIEVLMDASSADVIRKLISFQPTILHYAGHGSKNGIASTTRDLFLQDDLGNKVPRSGEDIGMMLKSLNHPIKLLVLNACHSAGMISDLRTNVGCLIGMQDSVFDSEAAKFAEALYSLLSNGKSVEEAFQVACLSMDKGHKVPELCSGTLNASELRIVS